MRSQPVVIGGKSHTHGGSGGIGGRSVFGLPHHRGSGGGFLFGLLLVFVLVFMTQNALVEAKRGCAKFGHSCYGGMGKRANSLNAEYTGQEINAAEQENPAFVFTGPRSDYPAMSPRQLLQQQQQLFARNMLLDEAQESTSFETPKKALKMSPYLIRQFLRSIQSMNRQQNERDSSQAIDAV